jgi:hypothetical protein
MKILANVLAMIAAATLLGCDVVGSISDYQQKASAVAATLEKEVGSKPLVVSSNMNNGGVLNVNIVFDGSKVSSLTVKELETRSKAAVIAHFKEEPAELVVSVRWEK